jgi:hypothetical protein
MSATVPGDRAALIGTVTRRPTPVPYRAEPTVKAVGRLLVPSWNTPATPGLFPASYSQHRPRSVEPHARYVRPTSGHQQMSSNRSRTRTPKRRPSTGTRSSMPWNIPEKSNSGGSLSGLNPKHLMPSLLNDFASVPADRQ